MQIGLGFFEGLECEIWPLHLTLALASNTAYCTTVHMHDKTRLNCINIVISCFINL